VLKSSRVVFTREACLIDCFGTFGLDRGLGARHSAVPDN